MTCTSRSARWQKTRTQAARIGERRSRFRSATRPGQIERLSLRAPSTESTPELTSSRALCSESLEYGCSAVRVREYQLSSIYEYIILRLERLNGEYPWALAYGNIHHSREQKNADDGATRRHGRRPGVPVPLGGKSADDGATRRHARHGRRPGVAVRRAAAVG